MRDALMNYMLETLEIASEDAEELLGLFLETFDEHRRMMRDAVGKNDFTELRQLTHTMIGCAGNVGADQIVEVVQKINTAAKAGDPAACLAGIDELDQLHAQLSEA